MAIPFPQAPPDDEFGGRDAEDHRKTRSQRVPVRPLPRSRAGRLFEAVACVWAAGALLWGLLEFGATEILTYYRLFLLLLIPTFLLAWSGRRELGRVHSILLSAVGVFLLLQVYFQPTLESRGYVVLSLGWLAFFGTLLISLGGFGRTLGVAGFLVLLGTLEALYGIVQALGGVDYIGAYYRNLGRVATGSFVNPNHFAGLLNMILPLGIGLILGRTSWPGQKGSRSEQRARLWMGLFLIAFMGLAVLLSLSRAGSIALLASVVLMVVLSLFKKKTPSRSFWIPVLLFLLITVGLGSWVVLDTLLARFAQMESGVETRLPVYRDSLHLIADHSLTGVGPRMYAWRFRPYQTERIDKLYDHTHNDFLQSAAEWGIPAALLFWGFVLWRLHGSIHLFLETRHPGLQGLSLGCAAAVFSILLHGLVDFNLQIPANWIMFCTILALSWSLTLHRSKWRSLSSRSTTSPGPAR